MSENSAIERLNRLSNQLAQLGREERRQVMQSADAARRRQVQRVVCEVREELLPLLSGRKAAAMIADAVRGRRCGADPALRAKVVDLLKAQLGQLSDIPEAARIRQLLSAR
jgi:hypothetical protein